MFQDASKVGEQEQVNFFNLHDQFFWNIEEG